MGERGLDFRALWENIKGVVAKALIAIQPILQVCMGGVSVRVCGLCVCVCSGWVWGHLIQSALLPRCRQLSTADPFSVPADAFLER